MHHARCRVIAKLALLAAIVAPATSRADDETFEATIETAPIIVRPVASYEVPLKLHSARQTTLVALADGTVQLIRGREGELAQAQTEVVRLNSQLQQLEMERARAAYELAQQLLNMGEAAGQKKVAKKDLEIAQLRLDMTSTRMPFDAHVLHVHVVEGQYVRKGDPLLTIADQTRLVVQVPIERQSVQVGDSLELKIESQSATGKVTNIVPLPEKFDPLRPLFASVAAATVEFENAQGRYQIGQTVHSPMIPRHPVTEVPTRAIANSDGGETERKVQVIRDGLVRDVPVRLLGQAGEEYVWVSGRFAPEDRLILSSTPELVDGMPVTPAGIQAASPRSPTPTATPPGAPGAPVPVPPMAPPTAPRAPGTSGQ